MTPAGAPIVFIVDDDAGEPRLRRFGRGTPRPRRPIRSNTHAPDQTAKRPRLLHCILDLAAPSRCYLTSR